MRIAVTGSSGYIAQALIKLLADRGDDTLAISRGPCPPAVAELRGVQWVTHDEGIPDAKSLAGCDALVHLAGRAHTRVSHDAGRDLFDKTNRAMVRRCVQAAQEAKVGRFVQVSTLGVHGGWSSTPVTEQSPLLGTSPYAHSKIAAERELAQAYAQDSEALCIVRPPMVYGVACPGNFPRLINLVRQGLPLPLASIRNARSFIQVQNLADFLATVADRKTPGGTYVIGDGSDFTVPELIQAIAHAYGQPARLLPFPPLLLRWAASLIGKRGEIDSLTQPMLVDWSHARTRTGWSAPVPGRQALLDTLAGFARCK